MSVETIAEEAAARLRAAGLPETTAQTLAGRVAGTLERLRQQAEALPSEVEPATTFSATSRPLHSDS